MILIKAFIQFFNVGKFIRKNRLYYFYLLPFLLSLVVYFFLYKQVAQNAEILLNWVYNYLGLTDLLAKNAVSWWAKLLGWLSNIFSFGFTVVAYYFSMVILKYLLLALLSPWFAFISEQTEKRITGKDYPFSVFQLLKDAWRGFLISLRNFIYEFGLNLILLIVSLFFPLIAPIVFIINLYLGCYFYGFSMMDYVCERKKLSVRNSILYVRKNKQTALGIGLGMWLLNFIPIIGLTIGSVNGAVAAVLQEAEKR